MIRALPLALALAAALLATPTPTHAQEDARSLFRAGVESLREGEFTDALGQSKCSKCDYQCNGGKDKWTTQALARKLQHDGETHQQYATQGVGCIEWGTAAQLGR